MLTLGRTKALVNSKNFIKELNPFLLEERTGNTPYQNENIYSRIIFDILTPFGASLHFCSCVPRNFFFFFFFLLLYVGCRSFVLQIVETWKFLVFRRWKTNKMLGPSCKLTDHLKNSFVHSGEKLAAWWFSEGSPVLHCPPLQPGSLQRVCAQDGSNETAPRKFGEFKVEVTCKAQESH